MSALTGTGVLARFALRRDRVRLSVWVLALAGSVAASIPPWTTCSRPTPNGRAGPP